jgi:hypothetical protein
MVIVPSLENDVHTLVPGFGRSADAELPFIDYSLADDLIWGGTPIASFVSCLTGEEFSPKRIYQLADKGLLSVGHFGGRLVASKRRITAHFAAIASGSAAATAAPARHSRRMQSVRRGRQAERVAKHQIRQGVADPVAVGSEAALGAFTSKSFKDSPEEPGNTRPPSPVPPCEVPGSAEAPQ